jgi:hypothetical protein
METSKYATARKFEAVEKSVIWQYTEKCKEAKFAANYVLPVSSISD